MVQNPNWKPGDCPIAERMGYRGRDFVAEYLNEPREPCCEGYAHDMVHDASCATTAGFYRCVECDLPFQRETCSQPCNLCNGSGFVVYGDEEEDNCECGGPTRKCELCAKVVDDEEVSDGEVNDGE